MPKIVIEINKEGIVNIEGKEYNGKECENSKIFKKLISHLQQEGEIDNITLKYQEQKTKNIQTIEIEDLI